MKYVVYYPPVRVPRRLIRSRPVCSPLVPTDRHVICIAAAVRCRVSDGRKDGRFLSNIDAQSKGSLCRRLLPCCISSRGRERTAACEKGRGRVTWQQQVIIFVPSLHAISQKQYEIYFQRYWWRWQCKNCYTQSKVSSNKRGTMTE